MRVYQCDGCSKVVEDPYTVKMKEFCIEVSGGFIPTECNTKRKAKIHLCENCFKGLHNIAKKI